MLGRREVGRRACVTIIEALDLLIDDVRPEPFQSFGDVWDDLLSSGVFRQRSDEVGDDCRELRLSDAMREMRRAQAGGGSRLRAGAAQEIIQELDVVAP